MRGFSLTELLVAMALLVLVIVTVVGVVNSTALVTTKATKQISAEEEGRQVMDRISSDIERMILRKDLAQEIGKVAGNDGFSFYAKAPGYDGDRAVSRIGYHVVNEGLRREAVGMSWSGAGQVPFGASGSPVNASEDQIDSLSPGVFRFEVAFLLKNGSILAQVPSLTSTDPGEEVSAVIVGVAVMDERSRKLVKGNLSNLAQQFPDAKDSVAGTDWEDFTESWSDVLESPDFLSNGQDPDFPTAALSSIRVFRRVYYLNQ